MKRVARAKVNLYLEVIGRRPDGYHEIATLLRTVAFGDDVEVETTARSGVVVTTRGADLPDDDRNLAVRAAKAHLAATGAPGGVRLLLEKRVPLGGGLGGGSSDAATVLRCLDAVAGPRALGPERLAALAASLGSDVPFLLDGGAAVARGRGERLTPLPSGPPLTLVLAFPGVPADTAAVYARSGERVRRAPAGGLDAAVEALASGVPSRVRDAHHNDLAHAALRVVPALARFAAEMERALGRPPCLSGSGSTFFDVPDPGEADDVVARLAHLPGRRQVVVTG